MMVFAAIDSKFRWKFEEGEEEEERDIYIWSIENLSRNFFIFPMEILILLLIVSIDSKYDWEQ